MTAHPASAAARIGADIGGTFTDVVIEWGQLRCSAKLLTTPKAPEQAVLRGIEMVLNKSGLRPADVALIIHGNTLVTNALIERKGAMTAFVTTEGYRDTLEMGTESRFDQYDLAIEKPLPWIPRRLRFTVPERVSAAGDILLPFDAAAARRVADRLAAQRIESVAIGFINSFANPAHERRMAELVRAALPAAAISLSSDVSPEIREYERFSTTAANALVQPLIARYLTRLEGDMRAAGFACPLFLMLSGGGIADLDTARRYPIRLLESGPAGGVMLAAHIARQCKLDKVLSFDMGGTTAKICLLDDAQPQTTRSFEVARMYRFTPGSGLPVKVPTVEMVEIGAGGGSIAHIDALGRIQVGPESAGAEPGPACYGRGGARPAVTDANVVLGRIDPAEFAGGRMTLDADAARTALMREVGAALGASPALAALGVIEIVDENMANAARQHAVESGKSLHDRTMIAFGGCAPLHAARIADKLDIDRVIVPTAAGVGSAVGFLRAPVSYDVSRSVYARLRSFAPERINAAFEAMRAEAAAIVGRAAPGVPAGERRLGYMRYVGQGHEIAVEIPARPLTADDAPVLRAAYDDAYRAMYGRLIDGVDVEIVAWSLSIATPPAAAETERNTAAQPTASKRIRAIVDAASGATLDAQVFVRGDLAAGAVVSGPAVIVEDETSTIVPAHFTARINSFGYIVLERSRAAARRAA